MLILNIIPLQYKYGKNMNLKKALNNINVKADWIGLREVKESTIYRIIRDLNPESNNTTLDHGIMVEVLVNGQFGYCATNNISYEAINDAANKAYIQALNASEYSVYSFTESVRPKSTGEYQSPYKIKNMSLNSLTDTLIKSNQALKGSKKLFQLFQWHA